MGIKGRVAKSRTHIIVPAICATVGIGLILSFVLPYTDPLVQNAIATNSKANETLQACNGSFVKECQESRNLMRQTCASSISEREKKYLTFCDDKRLTPNLPPEVMERIRVLNSDAESFQATCKGDIYSLDCAKGAQALRVMCSENPEFRDRQILKFCVST